MAGRYLRTTNFYVARNLCTLTVVEPPDLDDARDLLGGDPATLGLRARKKLATREALSNAALDLAIERGPDNVRVEDIAARAGVSPRTYNNYFSSREEAILALVAARSKRVAAALRERPADEPLGEAIIAAFQSQTAHPEPDKAMIRLITCSPALRGEFLKMIASTERPLAEAIAERTGLDAERDLFPGVLAATVYASTRAAREYWLRPETTEPLAAVMRDALAWLKPLLAPPPVPTTPRKESAC
jgi:AcrR family transcriptional regulator